MTQGLIGLIEYSYHQGIPSFLEAQLQRTPGLRMGDRTGKFFWVCISEDKSAHKRVWLICGASI
jgi:hypothetical protein